MLSKAIESAQKKIEGNNFGIRKQLLEYDQVMNEQRELIYAERRKVLDGENMKDSVLGMMDSFIDDTVLTELNPHMDKEDWDLVNLNMRLQNVIPALKPVTPDDLKFGPEGIAEDLKEQAHEAYEMKESQFPDPEAMREVERVVLLRAVDNKWMAHIDDMDQLRQGIGLQAYGQRDPLVEYRMIGFDMFNEMQQGIIEDTIRLMFHIKVEQKVEREEVAKPMATNRDESAVRKPKHRENEKVYPNDPCPCGSGKKYKNCCGRKGKR